MGERARGREGETGRKGGLYRDLFDYTGTSLTAPPVHLGQNNRLKQHLIGRNLHLFV